METGVVMQLGWSGSLVWLVGFHEKAVFGAVVEQFQVGALSLAVLVSRDADKTGARKRSSHRSFVIHPVVAILGVGLIYFEDRLDESITIFFSIALYHDGEVRNRDSHRASWSQHAAKLL